MSHFFLDSSAIVKPYSPETGSAWVKSLPDLAAGHTITLAEIAVVTVSAALAVRHRARHGISRQELDDALSDFLGHCDAEYQLVPLDRSIIERAVGLTRNHRLRGYEAVKLGVTLVASQALAKAGLEALITFTADEDILNAAQAEGLPAKNPNDHQ